MKYTPFAKLIRATSCEYIATMEDSGNPSTAYTPYTYITTEAYPDMSQSCMDGVWNNLLVLFMSFETSSYQTGRKIQTAKCPLATEFVADKLEIEDIVKFWSLTKRQLSDEA